MTTPNNSPQEELKPCPFCGMNQLVVVSLNGDQVACDICNIYGPSGYGNDKNAVAKVRWNTRPTPETPTVEASNVNTPDEAREWLNKKRDEELSTLKAQLRERDAGGELVFQKVMKLFDDKIAWYRANDGFDSITHKNGVTGSCGTLLANTWNEVGMTIHHTSLTCGQSLLKELEQAKAEIRSIAENACNVEAELATTKAQLEKMEANFADAKQMGNTYWENASELRKLFFKQESELKEAQSQLAEANAARDAMRPLFAHFKGALERISAPRYYFQEVTVESVANFANEALKFDATKAVATDLPSMSHDTQKRSDVTGAEVEDYLIWSIEHQAWWKPQDWGYTSNVNEAGRYTKEGARFRCDNLKKDKPVHIKDAPLTQDDAKAVVEELVANLENCQPHLPSMTGVERDAENALTKARAWLEASRKEGK